MSVGRKEREQCADLLDQAAQTSEDLLNADIANARAGTAPEKHHAFDGKHCVEETCGVEIPAERLAMGRVRCVDCQGRLEEIRRRGPQ